MSEHEDNPSTRGPSPLVGQGPLLPREKPTSCSRARWWRAAARPFPILTWLPTYDTECAVSDAIAGVTVGLTVIPQGIAYAVVAGLPPQYGLYSAFMGCFVYCVLGSTKDITIGPTAIMALMTGVHAQLGPDYAVLLAFLSGLIILACGLLRLGFLIDFISVPVIAGFTSAAAITIASGQVKSLLGVTVLEKAGLHLGVLDGWVEVVGNISSCRWQDAALGLSCCAILLGLKYLGRVRCLRPEGRGRGAEVLRKMVWFAATARNAIIVLLCLVLAWLVDPACPELEGEARAQCVFSLTGQIQSGLPAFQAPPFHIAGSNTTATDDDTSFAGMVAQLGAALFIIPMIAILESVAIAKAFAGGKPVDASQEMVALGVCNILGSFVQAMPTTGSFSRTAVNSASGVRTPLGGAWTGALVILCLAFLMPYCAFIPKATLAAVIITAVVSSIEWEMVRPIWRSKRTDLVPGVACFLGCLLYELEMGIGLGVAIQVVMVLYHTARPGLQVELRKVPCTETTYLCLTPSQAVVFPSASYLRGQIAAASLRQDTLLPVVIDCAHVSQLDFTAAKAFHAMLKEFEGRGQEVFWLNCSAALAATVASVAGRLFLPIGGVHQLIEDERDNEAGKLLGCKGKECPDKGEV